MILDKVESHVYQELAPKISSEVKTLKEEMSVKAGNSKLLVGFENHLENIKMFEKRRLMRMFSEMIDWLMMLNKNPCQR